MKVKCINIREALPKQITIESIYYIDVINMFDDQEEWYVPTYLDSEFKYKIGNLKLNHFTRVE